MKKIKKVLTIIVIIIAIIIIKKIANPIDMFRSSNYNSKSIYVYNITDDKEVLGINENKRLYPASLTKIMTVTVALNCINNLSDMVSIDIDSYRELINENSSMAGFYGGETVTYRDLLYGAILESGGECAETLAVNLGGDRKSFVDKMNDKSRQIGLKDTNFKNPTGLDEKDQYSTAKDICMLIKSSLKDGNFRAIFTKEEYTSIQTEDHPNGVYMQSTVLKKLKDKNLENFTIIGGKSGTTNEAGRCWATLAIKNNKEYVVVVMGAQMDNNDGEEGQIIDTIKILSEI